jgi:phosphoglycolate phosphatase
MKHVIFDFDGTLVDSLPVVVRIVNEVLPDLDLDDKKLAVMRELPPREVLKYSGVPYWRLAQLLIKGKRILSKRLDELKVFPGIDEVIKKLHKDGYQICVVSSNSEDNIRQVLKRDGIEKYFAGVYGNVGLFNKTRAFKVVLKDQKTTASNAIYIGDEVRDIEAAHKGNIDIISVTWGYNGQKILKKYQPTYLATTPQELLKTITQAA